MDTKTGAHVLTKMVIRPILESDLPDLEWDGEFRHFRRLYAEIFESTREGKTLMWAAFLDGAGLIGQLFVQLYSSRPELANGRTRAYIYGFRVRSEYRGLGIGSSMMDVAEKDLATRAFRLVTLNVGKDNPDARRLYERRGYRVVADEPGRWSYINDRGERCEVHEPAWRMEKNL
jgi:ribosomal protein S18 acetylase RimI-like enzyme